MIALEEAKRSFSNFTVLVEYLESYLQSLLGDYEYGESLIKSMESIKNMDRVTPLKYEGYDEEHGEYEVY